MNRPRGWARVNEWLNVQLGYSLRLEWFISDVHAKDVSRVIDWMAEAYELGYKHGKEETGARDQGEDAEAGAEGQPDGQSLPEGR